MAVIRDMRSKFGPWIVGGIIGLIAFVFVFSGVFSPDPIYTGGMAGSVNGIPISQGDFSRALNQRMSMFKGMNFTPEQLKQFGIYDGVFRDLVNRRLMIEEGKKIGVMISDEEVRDTIRKIPVFQEDGKFDRKKYEDLLKANRLNPGGFEKQIREDLVIQYWQNFFTTAVQVNEIQVQREYEFKENKRDIQYVMLDTAAAEAKLKIDKKKIARFLKDSKNNDSVKKYFEERKTTQYKDKKIDDVKDSIAQTMIREKERKKIMDRYSSLGQRVAKLMTGKKSSDKKINAILKKEKVTVAYSGLLDQKTKFIPKVGYANEALKDAFAIPSPISTKDGGKAKVYQVTKGILIAALHRKTTPDITKLKKEEKDKLIAELRSKKEQTLFQQWINELNKNAEILKNQKFLDGGGA